MEPSLELPGLESLIISKLQQEGLKTVTQLSHELSISPGDILFVLEQLHERNPLSVKRLSFGFWDVNQSAE